MSERLANMQEDLDGMASILRKEDAYPCTEDSPCLMVAEERNCEAKTRKGWGEYPSLAYLCPPCHAYWAMTNAINALMNLQRWEAIRAEEV